jgi:Ubiquitin carboxyl-terminal hydrolase
MNFASILRYSLLRQTTHKATCQSCKQFTNFSTKRSIPSRDLPPILAVNAGVYNAESLEVWLDARNETFLKSRVRIHGQVEGMDDQVAADYQLRVCSGV